jgi:hypothetical protein
MEAARPTCCCVLFCRCLAGAFAQPSPSPKPAAKASPAPAAKPAADEPAPAAAADSKLTPEALAAIEDSIARAKPTLRGRDAPKVLDALQGPLEKVSQQHPAAPTGPPCSTGRELQCRPTLRALPEHTAAFQPPLTMLSRLTHAAALPPLSSPPCRLLWPRPPACQSRLLLPAPSPTCSRRPPSTPR